MEVFELLKTKKECIADAPPACSVACPLGIDIRDFIKKINTGLFSAAYKTFNRFAVMPGVVCHICDEPCKNACVRRELDDAVSLRELERYCWQENRSKSAESYYIPPKDKRILVIGGGISGISCAVKLAQRGYQVELMEKDHKLGGRLWEIDDKILPKTVLEEELEKISQLKFLNITLNTQVKELDTSSYDAVLVTTGTNSECFGAPKKEYGMFWQAGVFFAGSMLCPGQSPLESIYQGCNISYLIEEYMKVGRVVTSPEKETSFLYQPDLSKIIPVNKVYAQDQQNWTTEEAKTEAKRCLLCSCSNCSDVCPMMQHYQKKFKNLMAEVTDTLDDSKLVEKRGLYPIMSCTQCGSCKLSCPVDIDTKSICLESRRVLQKKGQLPDAHYEYWLNDMVHANSDEASLFIPAGDNDKAKYVYFPGCQMGASNPTYVVDSYQWLSKTFPDNVALMLYCCGAPALWSGNEKMHNDVVDAIKNKWMEWGQSTFILACPTCEEMFRKHLPEIKTASLWNLMADHYPHNNENKGTVSVFDPCSSKEDRQTRQNIRTLITKAGYSIAELNTGEDEALCCGYGGLIYSTNPELFDKICESNKRLSSHELITYCTNCRDIFITKNKNARHILDLLFETEPDALGKVPDLTERRTNRKVMNKQIMKEMLNVEYKEIIKPYDHIKLIIAPDVKVKMDLQLIIEDNIKQVIACAETTGSRLYSKEADLYTAHMLQGNLTFWVQYRPVGDGYAITNVYFHRVFLMED